MAATRGSVERLDRGTFRSRLQAGTVVLSERVPGVRSVSIGVWLRQGAAHETAEQRGISHFLEHLAFKGTARRSARQLALEIERLGGSLDAWTTHDYTTFHARVPDTHLAEAVDVLTDLVFHPLLRPDDLERERHVVLEEIARAEETPEDLAFERHARLLYGAHPYGAPILGTPETVGRLETGHLERLHRAAYAPDNALVAAAGRLEHERLLELLDVRLPARSAARPEKLDPVRPGGPGRFVESRPGGTQSHIVVGGAGVAFGDPLHLPLSAVSLALGGGMSSRLFQTIREERGLAYSVYSFQGAYATGGHVGAYAGTHEATAEHTLDALLAELGRVARDGLSEGELEEARQQMCGQLNLALESTAYRMERLAVRALYDQPYLSVREMGARVRAIGREEAAAAASLLHPDRLTVLALMPGGDDGRGPGLAASAAHEEGSR